MHLYIALCREAFTRLAKTTQRLALPPTLNPLHSHTNNKNLSLSAAVVEEYGEDPAVAKTVVRFLSSRFVGAEGEGI
jgi:hypothetical protein